MQSKDQYRGKRVIDGLWIKGMIFQPSQKSNPSIMLTNRYGESYEVIEDTVRQSTGLLDRNLFTIFEGDILRLLYTDWPSKDDNDPRTLEEYLRDILIKYFTPTAISTGYNHNFGYKKSGNVKYLAAEAQKYDYRYFELPPQKINNVIISSTAIREALSKGQVEKANSMLGYKFTISGEVVKGKQIGRTIGFRTANLVYPPELIVLPFGVYAVDVRHGENTYKGIANFGVRPTVNGVGALLEVHILEFDKEIYGEKISVEFKKMIRKEKKFASLDELKNQIQKDINLCCK